MTHSHRAHGRNRQTKHGTHPSSHKQCRNYGTQFPNEGGKTKCTANGKACDQFGKTCHFAYMTLSVNIIAKKFEDERE